MTAPTVPEAAAQAHPAASKLQEEYDLLKLQLEAVPDGVLVVDENWRMVFFNQRFIEMWEIPSHVLDKRDDRASIQSVLDKLEDPDGFLRRVEHLMQHRHIPSRDELRLRDGRTFERYTTPLVNREGKWRGRVWFFRDISARKAAERTQLELARQRQQMEKAESLRTMAAAVTHNFNNILTVILGNLELALDAHEPAQLRRHLGACKEAALRAAQIGRRLLTYLGTTPVTMGTVPCSEVIEQCAADFRQHLPAGVEIVLDLDSTILVRGDQRLLEEMIGCLLANSVEAMPAPGGRITVQTRPTAARPPADHWVVMPPAGMASAVRITVQDTGCGVPPADLERIFEPFYTTREIGRGLGLATVAGIVRLLDGGLGITSRPDEGTTIHLVLAGTPNGPADEKGQRPDPEALPKECEQRQARTPQG